MKKLKKIKLDIEKDVISSISIDDQLQIKGGNYLGGGDNGGFTGRNCSFGGCASGSCTAGGCGAVSVQACGSGNTGGGGYTTGIPTARGCGANQTQNCAPTGSAVSEGEDYNCYTIRTMCDC